MTKMLKVGTLVASFAIMGCYAADMPTHDDEYQDAPALIEVPKMGAAHATAYSNSQSSQNPASSQWDGKDSSYSNEDEWPAIIELPSKIEIPKKK